MDYQNKTVVISGGSKGIGEACALAFHRDGAKVAILDLVEPSFSDDRILYIDCDVSVSAAVEPAMKLVFEKFGSIDYLVNNAGIQRYGSVTNTSEDDWDLVMNVNLKSYYLCARFAIPFMTQSGKGVIINMSSVQAFVTQQNVSAYATAKTAILGLTRSIAIDYAPDIRCIAVCPGTIDTPMLRNALALSADPDEVMKECEDMHLLERIGKPEEVAATVKFLCSDDAAFITGESIRVDGGLGIMIRGSRK